MIKFFRKIRQKLLVENRFSKYLIYAIGEIILVVIGILIALQVNNANETRKQNERSIVFLQKLKAQIDKNSERATDYLEENKFYLDVSKRLLKTIDNNPQQLLAKQLDTLVFLNALDFHINLDMIALEEGRINENLANVQPDSLRTSIYTFIKVHKDYIEREKVINEDLSLNFKPFLNKHYNIRNLVHTIGIGDLGASNPFKTGLLQIIQHPEFENTIVTRILLQEDMVDATASLVEILKKVDTQLEAVLN